LSTIVGVFATGCEPTFEDPCEEDRFACDEGTAEFKIDETCELTGDLDVEVGHGAAAFTALGAEQWPEVISGSQGGQHAFIGLRVKNAALDRYSMLKVNVRMHSKRTLEHDTCDQIGREQIADDSRVCWHLDGQRDVVLGRKIPIQTNSAGEVEEYGILVFLDKTDAERKRIGLEVTDPCNRKGQAVHEVGKKG